MEACGEVLYSWSLSVLRYETFILKQFMGECLKVLAQSTIHLRKPFVVHLNSFLLMYVILLVIRVVHHLFASRCKRVLIVPIKLRGITTILYRVMPKIGRNTLKWPFGA